MKRETLDTAARRQAFGYTINYGKTPRPAHATPAGRAWKERQRQIEMLAERRELEAELTDW